MYDVTAIGELLIDFTCQSLDPEGYPTLAAHPGGAPVNFLAAVARAGGKTAMIGKVGRDTFGTSLIRTLDKLGIATAGVVTGDEAFTTLAFVTLDETGDRSFSFARKPGADTQLQPDEVNRDLIAQTRALHFGTLSLTNEPSASAVRQAVRLAREKGKLISFDPNLRLPLWDSPEAAKTQMLWGLSQADVVKISDDEAEFLFGLSPEAGAARILEEFGVKVVFVTCGAAGCWFQSGAARGRVPGLTGIRMVDTTGAGDIFGGTALWGILQRGKSPETLDTEALAVIAQTACVTASLSTTRPGGITSVPTPQETQKYRATITTP